MALNTKKIIGYGCLGVIAAPVVVPLAFVAYVGTKATRFAFKHATPVAFALALGGVATYAGCHYKEPIIAAVHEMQHQGGLERRVQAPVPASSVPDATTDRSNRGPVPLLDEPDTAYYYVREGETLGQIAARTTNDPRNYVAIAAASRISNPDDVAVGTLLRIPQHLCSHAVPGLYDKVPALESRLLPGSVTISAMFGARRMPVCVGSAGFIQ